MPDAPMHPLEKYRKAHTPEISRRDFGAKIGVSDVQVWRIENGARLPSMALAQRIFEVTEGKVTPDDFLPPQPAPEPERLAG